MSKQPDVQQDEVIVLPSPKKWPKSIYTIIAAIILGGNAGDVYTYFKPSDFVKNNSLQQELIVETKNLLITSREIIDQQKKDHDLLIEQKTQIIHLKERLSKLDTNLRDLEKSLRMRNGGTP